jgi:hypothetical protein
MGLQRVKYHSHLRKSYGFGAGTIYVKEVKSTKLEGSSNA